MSERVGLSSCALLIGLAVAWFPAEVLQRHDNLGSWDKQAANAGIHAIEANRIVIFAVGIVIRRGVARGSAFDAFVLAFTVKVFAGIN